MALSKLLDSKQKSMTSLIQKNSTVTNIAITITGGKYDVDNIMWKRVDASFAAMEFLQTEIHDTEEAILEHTQKKRKYDDETQLGSEGELELVSTTPVSSVTSDGN